MTTQISTLEEYKSTYKRSVEDPEGFWKEQANTFTWKRPFDKVLEWNFDEPDVKWFINGKLNITENCLDRHIAERGIKLRYFGSQMIPMQLLSDIPTVSYLLRSIDVRMGSKRTV